MKLVSVFTLAALFAFGCAKKSDTVQMKFQTASIKVESAQCGSCATAITKALKEFEGVENAEVDVKTKTASVTFLPLKTSLGSLEEAITRVGYSANDKKADPKAYEKLDECCKVE